MALLLERLSSKISLRWIQQNVTVFADDIHIACVFHDEEGLLEGLKNFGIIIDDIRGIGLLLSPPNRVFFSRALTRYTFWRNKLLSEYTSSDARVLRLSTADGPLFIREKQVSLLGTMVSYTNYEMLTVQLRLRTGWNAYGRGSTDLQLRLQLMKPCVLPCICYGILFVGVTSPGFMLFSKQIFMLYRRLLGNLSHHTRQTNIDVFEHYSLKCPDAILASLLHQSQARLLKSLANIDSFDIIHSNDWNPLELTRKTLERADPQDLQHWCAGSLNFHCSLCGFVTATSRELQRHLTCVHQRPRQVTQRLDFEKDTKDGYAICAHCNTTFQSWTSFKHHIKFQVCRSNHVTPPPEAHEDIPTIIVPSPQDPLPETPFLEMTQHRSPSITVVV